MAQLDFVSAEFKGYFVSNTGISGSNASGEHVCVFSCLLCSCSEEQVQGWPWADSPWKESANCLKVSWPELSRLNRQQKKNEEGEKGDVDKWVSIARSFQFSCLFPDDIS